MATTQAAWIETDEAGRLLGLPAGTVRAYCLRGTLRSKRVGRTVLVSSASVSAYLAGRRSPGRPKKNLEK